jgi:hypothetical protein
MALTLKGGVTGALEEVETASLAARVVPMPADPGALGSYRKAMRSGTIAAGVANTAPLFSFRYGGANLCIIKKIILSVAFSTAFAPGFFALDGFVARAFTANDTGGTAGTLTGNNAKLRTSYGVTGVSDFRIATTGLLGAGTRTLDTDPFATTTFTANVLPAGSTTNPSTSMPFDFHRATGGEETLTLVTNEGFVIIPNVPATGTWQLGVDVTWLERALGSWP